jgi:hypothetical protein
MPDAERLRAVFHGAITILVGLLAGLVTVNEEEPARLWHTAHEALIMIGILMLAISAAMPVLVLTRSESRALVWALLATGYGLMIGLLVQGITGQHAFSPTTDPVLMIAFIGNAAGMGGSVIATALTIMGARAAIVAQKAGSDDRDR